MGISAFTNKPMEIKRMPKRTPMSESSKRRRAYIRSHNFSIEVTDEGKCIVTVTEKIME